MFLQYALIGFSVLLRYAIILIFASVLVKVFTTPFSSAFLQALAFYLLAAFISRVVKLLFPLTLVLFSLTLHHLLNFLELQLYFHLSLQAFFSAFNFILSVIESFYQIHFH